MNEWLLHSNLINVVLVLLLLGFLFKKFNLAGFVDIRKIALEKEVEEAERRKTEALAELQSVTIRLQRLNKEIDVILSDAEQSAEALARNIMAAAQEEADKLVAASKKRVEQERNSLSRELQEQLVSDALEDVRERLRVQMSEEAQRQTIERFIEEIQAV